MCLFECRSYVGIELKTNPWLHRLMRHGRRVQLVFVRRFFCCWTKTTAGGLGCFQCDWLLLMKAERRLTAWRARLRLLPKVGASQLDSLLPVGAIQAPVVGKSNSSTGCSTTDFGRVAWRGTGNGDGANTPPMYEPTTQSSPFSRAKED